MSIRPRLSTTDIERLLRGQCIGQEWPWGLNEEEEAIEGFIKETVAEVRRKAHVLERTEYGHYGSGYASFVEAWFYRADDLFRVGKGESYQGLFVLFSRLSPFIVMGEGRKAWDRTGESSFLPHFELVDQLTHPGVRELSEKIEPILAAHGWIRLRQEDLSDSLPPAVRVPTILTDRRAYQHFDALFHWED